MGAHVHQPGQLLQRLSHPCAFQVCLQRMQTDQRASILGVRDTCGEAQLREAAASRPMMLISRWLWCLLHPKVAPKTCPVNNPHWSRKNTKDRFLKSTALLSEVEAAGGWSILCVGWMGGVSCEKWVVLALVPVLTPFLGPQASLRPLCACFLFCKMTWVHLLQTTLKVRQFPTCPRAEYRGPPPPCGAQALEGRHQHLTETSQGQLSLR